MMSAVVYDVGYDTQNDSKEEKHGYCVAFGCNSWFSLSPTRI